MELVDTTLKDFTTVLASKAAVPGGGGASALVGAVGVALGNMVGSLTTGKKKYAAVEEEIQSLMSQAEELRQQLLDCVGKDAAAFEPLSKAYAIPGDDPMRVIIMEECLRNAATVPMEILELSCKAIALQKGFAEKGSALAVSDAGTGVVICKAAMLGAAINVKVNTKSMKDRAYAEEINAHVDQLTAEYGAMADEIFESVYGRFA